MSWTVLLWISLGAILVYAIAALIFHIYNRFSFSLDDIYECTIIRSVEYQSDTETVIWDFSLYETHKIVGVTLCVLNSIDEMLERHKDLSEEDYDLIRERYTNPMIFANQSVLHTREETIWLDML